MAMQEDAIVGVTVQSPFSFPTVLTPMGPTAVIALAKVMSEMGVGLPGVNSEAATAALFAGEWSERRKVAEGTRLYEFIETSEPLPIEGALRLADPNDRSLVIRWTRSFQEEIGESANDSEVRVDRGLESRRLWVWDRGREVVSMAVSREAVAGVVRLSGVYTPPERRNRGYAAACVHELSHQLGTPDIVRFSTPIWEIQPPIRSTAG
jgi:hypothetical protein